MPHTPYHFGLSTFLGLTFKKYIDVPVFVLANVITDIEVIVVAMLGLGWPVHRYVHTLVLGTAAGIIWAIAAYPLRHFFKKIMQILHIPYETGFLKMIISGVLGVWLHVVVDAVYHWDVLVFWPSRIRPFYRLITAGQLKIICVAFFFAALIPYVSAVRSYGKQSKTNDAVRKTD